jgi:Lrp/AsnC family transcriptional regulator, leucine-responsive regulatory protein
MKLSERDADILRYIELNAHEPLGNVAKALRIKEHNVRYSIKKFTSSGLIQQRVFIDMHRLGFMMHSIFCTLSAKGLQRKKDFIDAVKESEHVTMLFGLGGDFHFEIDVVTRSIPEFLGFLDWLSDRFKDSIQRKSVSMVAGFSIFGHRQLSTKCGPCQAFRTSAGQDAFAIDEMDHRILAVLSEGNCISITDLARKLGQPSTTVAFRINRMEEAKVISGYTYNVDANMLGLNSFLLLVYTKGGYSSYYRSLIYDFSARNREILYCGQSIGRWDYEIGCVVQNNQQAELMVQKLSTEYGDWISSIDMLPFFKTYKLENYPKRTFSSLYAKAV